MRPFVVDSLRDVPLFRDLPAEPPACFAILGGGEERLLAEGEATRDRAFHIVVRGDVQLDAGRRVKAGDYFGELALLASAPPPVAVACAASRLFSLPPETFARMLDACPRVARTLLEDFAARLTLQNPTSITPH